MIDDMTNKKHHPFGITSFATGILSVIILGLSIIISTLLAASSGKGDLDPDAMITTGIAMLAILVLSMSGLIMGVMSLRKPDTKKCLQFSALSSQDCLSR